jgi:hypothetical protein
MLLDDALLSAIEAKPLIRWLILILTDFRTVGTVKAVGYYCSLRNFGNFATSILTSVLATSVYMCNRRESAVWTSLLSSIPVSMS